MSELEKPLGLPEQKPMTVDDRNRAISDLKAKLKADVDYLSTIARLEASLLAAAASAERLEAENERLTEESARLRVGLNSAVGYMMNAQIDLRTGAPKQTAINTINGGIDVLRAALGAPK